MDLTWAMSARRRKPPEAVSWSCNCCNVFTYNLGNLRRQLALPREIGKWSLSSLQQRLVKTGGHLIKHTRYYWLLPKESHLTGGCFAECWQISGAAVAGGIGGQASAAGSVTTLGEGPTQSTEQKFSLEESSLVPEI